MDLIIKQKKVRLESLENIMIVIALYNFFFVLFIGLFENSDDSCILQ